MTHQDALVLLRGASGHASADPESAYVWAAIRAQEAGDKELLRRVETAWRVLGRDDERMTIDAFLDTWCEHAIEQADMRGDLEGLLQQEREACVRFLNERATAYEREEPQPSGLVRQSVVGLIRSYAGMIGQGKHREGS